MQKFICSFGMGTPLAGKYLEVEANDINHCSDILRDQSFLSIVGSIYPEQEGMALVYKYRWHKFPGGAKNPYANLDQVDWEMLRKQKEALLRVINKEVSVEDVEKELNGLIYMLDHIQDEATYAIDEDIVFGTEEEE